MKGTGNVVGDVIAAATVVLVVRQCVPLLLYPLGQDVKHAVFK